MDFSSLQPTTGGTNDVGYANPAFHPDLSYDNDGSVENGQAPPVIAKANVDGEAGEPTDAPSEALSDVEQAQQAKRDLDPLFYCKLICNYPKSAFGTL